MKRFWRTVLLAVLGFLGGFVLAAILGVLFLLPADGGGDAGGTAMGIFFGLAPAGGVIGAIAGVVYALTRRGKSEDTPSR